MATETVTIQVPEKLYRRLQRLAALSGRPLESLVAQTLSSCIPPLPDDLPPAMRDNLIALERLSDDELWQVTRSMLPEEQYAQFVDLREQQRAGTIRADDRAALDQLSQEADLLALRKAYAAVLLKWRGHRLPTLADLEAHL